MTQLFQSSGYLDGSCETSSNKSLPRELARLPPFLRVLLSTDGTVTKSLEAFFWEPVNVSCLVQGYVSLPKDLPSLAKLAGDEVLERSVSLIGTNSLIQYATASSYICADVLPDSIRDCLENGRAGIGELLRELGVETYREILSVGTDTEQVWRTYRILMANTPCIQITERFPLGVYGNPSI